MANDRSIPCEIWARQGVGSGEGFEPSRKRLGSLAVTWWVRTPLTLAAELPGLPERRGGLLGRDPEKGFLLPGEDTGS